MSRAILKELVLVLAMALSTAGHCGMKVVKTFHFDPAKETFQEVKDKVNCFVKHSTSNGIVQVVVKNGEYFITEQLHLTIKDTGSEKNPIVWRAETNGKVIVNGGIPITNFRKLTDKAVLDRLDPMVWNDVLVADLKELGITNLPWNAQLVQGKIQTLARYPNKGYLKVSPRSNAPKWTVKNRCRDNRKFVYDDERVNKWAGEKFIRVTGFLGCCAYPSSQLVEKFDVETQTITMPPRADWMEGISCDGVWFGENLLCEIDMPGEYYTDFQNLKVYYIKEKDNTDLPYITFSENILNVRNLNNLKLSGFVLKNSSGKGIKVVNCKNLDVVDCKIMNCYNIGMYFEGCENTAVKNCEISHTFKSGLWTVKKGGKSNFVLDGCKIHEVGRGMRTIFDNAVHSAGDNNIIRNCEIYNVFGTAMLFRGQNVVIENNFIHDICTHQHDGAAIYTRCNPESNSKIINNVIQNVYQPDPDAWPNYGVYIDEHAFGVLVKGNKIYNVKKGVNTCCFNNVIEYNDFKDVKYEVHVDAHKSVLESEVKKPRKTVIAYNRSNNKFEYLVYRGPVQTAKNKTLGIVDVHDNR